MEGYYRRCMRRTDSSLPLALDLLDRNFHHASLPNAPVNKFHDEQYAEN